jgi:cytochrome c oxidase subunit 2
MNPLYDLLVVVGVARPAAPLGYLSGAAGPAADPVLKLGWGLTALCVAVVLIILALLIIALKHRRTPADYSELGKEGGGPLWLYVGVGVSTVVLLVALFFALATLGAVAHPGSPPGLTVRVTAYNWWWKIDYQDDADPTLHFSTANEIHIPVGVPVQIELRSADVIHAFWVPRLAGKTQAIPGQVNRQWLQADEEGVYRGQCSQFCGPQHARMAFEVVAQPQAEFQEWLDAQRRPAPTPADVLSAAGSDVFMKRCAACHTVRGSKAAGVFGPDLTHLSSRRTIAAGTLNNTPQALLDWIRHAQEIKEDSLMPSIALDTEEGPALSAYLATLE